jgi:FkbM family methyltransferase
MRARLARAQARLGAARAGLANLSAVAWPARFYFRHTADRKIASYSNHVVHHSYGGHQLAISLEDPVAEDWYDHDWPLMPELARLRASRLRSGARVFDLGAHQGVVAMILARLVGPDGQVVAVEAERHNFEVALTNRNLNAASNVEILHAAAGAGEDSLYFRGGLNGAVASSGRFGLARVPAVSVDRLAELYGTPDVVFVDVEGYEQEVLRGAARTLTGGETDFFVEVHVGYGLESLGGSASSVLERFDPNRFRRLVSPARGEREEYSFRELDERPDLLDERFFLVALADR